jgi:hypothetical protein
LGAALKSLIDDLLQRDCMARRQSPPPWNWSKVFFKKPFEPSFKLGDVSTETGQDIPPLVILEDCPKKMLQAHIFMPPTASQSGGAFDGFICSSIKHAVL